MQHTLQARCSSVASCRPNTVARRPIAIKYSPRFTQLLCRATSEGEKATDDELVVPNTPPAKDSGSSTSAAAAEEQATEQGTSSSDEGMMSVEEIQRRAAQYRAEKSPPKEGFVEGVLEEVQLIQWPSPQSALLNTLLVVAIVAGTSALLFAVNTGLTEASKVLYPHH